MTSEAIRYRISDCIELDSGPNAIHRYKLFSSIFGKRIYGSITGFATLGRLPAITTDNGIQHLSEEQSRALKGALLSSARIVDNGFLLD